MEQEPIEQKLYQPLSLQAFAAQNIKNNLKNYDIQALAQVVGLEATLDTPKIVELKGKPRPGFDCCDVISNDHKYVYTYSCKMIGRQQQCCTQLPGSWFFIRQFCFSPDSKHYAYIYDQNRETELTIGNTLTFYSYKKNMPGTIRSIKFINDTMLGVLTHDAFFNVNIDGKSVLMQFEQPSWNPTDLHVIGDLILLRGVDQSKPPAREKKCIDKQEKVISYRPYDYFCWHQTKKKIMPVIFGDSVLQGYEGSSTASRLLCVSKDSCAAIFENLAYVFEIKEKDDAVHINQIACLKHSTYLYSAAISPSGTYIATSTGYPEVMVYIWHIPTKEIIANSSDAGKCRYSNATRSVLDLSWKNSGNALITQNVNGYVYKFDLRYLHLLDAIRATNQERKKQKKENNNNNSYTGN